MTALSEAIRQARKRQPGNVSQETAARIAGVSRPTYISYEKGHTEPSDSVRRRLAIAWNAPELVEGGLPNVGPPLFPVARDTIQIPLWPAVPAGDWEAPAETIDFYDVDVRLHKNNRIACKIVGDSMHPYLQQGDVGVFELNQHPQVGLIVLARNGNSEATVKQLSYNDSGYMLVSLRDGEEVHASKWELIAFLVARVRDLGPGRFNQVVNQGGVRPEELI